MDLCVYLLLYLIAPFLPFEILFFPHFSEGEGTMLKRVFS